MTKDERNKALIDRLILARNQLDDAIEKINVKGTSRPPGEPSDDIGTGILLTNHGCTMPQEYTLVVFGFDNYHICREALEKSRRP